MWNEKTLGKYDKICANYRTYNCKLDRFYSVNVKKGLKTTKNSNNQKQ